MEYIACGSFTREDLCGTGGGVLSSAIAVGNKTDGYILYTVKHATWYYPRCFLASQRTRHGVFVGHLVFYSVLLYVDE